ncbi:MAG: disulfide bond formation protein B [Gemmobacter sp.]
MTRTTLVLAAAGGSAALLAAALVSQYGFGLYPCALCLWQRWPHGAAIAIGLVALVLPGRILPLFGALAALATAGVGGFHAGVEQGWWAGLASCAGGPGIAGLPPEALLDPTFPVATAPRCDDIAFQFAGLSMAAWNMILSAGLAALWLAAARARAA